MGKTNGRKANPSGLDTTSAFPPVFMGAFMDLSIRITVCSAIGDLMGW